MNKKTDSCSKNYYTLSNRRRLFKSISVAAALSLLGVNVSYSQEPGQTVRIVVPFPAGNPVEAGARVLAEALKKTTGRNYIIDNKPGAGGLLGANEVARSKPDGSMLLYMTASHTSSAALYAKLPYDVIQDFTPISQIALAPGLALLVRSSSSYRSVNELIKAAQDKPNSVSYASLGTGQTSHIVGALFARAVKADFVHVPYRSSPMPDLLGGHVDFTWLGTAVAIPLITSGQVRVLAVSSERRLAEAPDAPTFAEMGLKDINVPAWTGMLGPRGMSQEMANRIQKEIAVAVKHPDYVAYVKTSGNQVVATTPSEFSAYYASEVNRYRKLLPPLGIKLE
jgi:tripartite-type tricarboxylate transporter receptor subunit TctC